MAHPLDGLGPKGAPALLVALADDPNRLVVPVDIANAQRYGFTDTCAGVVKEQQQGMVACPLACRLIGGGQQGIDLRLFQIGYAGRDALLDWHHSDLPTP